MKLNIPGPKRKLNTTLQVLRKPYIGYQKLLEKYGDPVFLDIIYGKIVLTADPLAVKELFTANTMLFDTFAPEIIVPVAGNNSFLTISGERHKRTRKLVMPSFVGENMCAYAQIMETTTRKYIEKIPIGQQFQMFNVAINISMDIMIRAVIGIEEETRVATFKNSFFEMIDATNPLMLYFRALQKSFFGLSSWDKFIKKRDQLDNLIMEEIDNRFRSDCQNRKDILSIFTSLKYEDGSKMSPQAIRDLMITTIFGGYETTAIAISWILYHLYEHPEHLEQFCEIINQQRDFISLTRNPYIKAVCNESLRLKPVIPDIFRTLNQPFTLKGYEIPAGITLGTSAGVLHFCEDIYPDPYTFSPQRFIDNDFHPWEFIPFGGGYRRCIGAAFAHFEMVITLATMLREFKFELREPKPVSIVRRSVTIAPKTGIRMVRIK